MVRRLAASRWNPLRLWRRVRDAYRRPDDVRFSLQLAYFLWRLADRMEQQPLPAFLGQLQTAPRPRARDLRSSVERINRLSRPWFATVFRGHNNCYVRSLMFCRFADPGGRTLRIHLLVDPRRASGERRHGHAWVTVGGEYCETPEPEILATAKHFYSFPAEDGV